MEAAEIERPTHEERTGWPGASWSDEVVEAPVGTTDALEAVEMEEPPLEARLVEETVVEALIEEQIVEVPIPEHMDDLKARIEETRRRIRHELEQPFMSADDVGAAPADDWTVSPAVPVAEPVAEPAVSPEPDLAESPVAMVDYDSEAEAVVEEPVDYDSMKSRIETVRSRLKAKAFDAMMSGESALLGRDTEDAEHRRRVAPSVDSEVDETIETSLREEEN
jgi:hypothetical protein